MLSAYRNFTIVAFRSFFALNLVGAISYLVVQVVADKLFREWPAMRVAEPYQANTSDKERNTV